MISVQSEEYIASGATKFTFIGTTGDLPPIGTYQGRTIANGSTYVDWSTGEMYRYDAPSQTWQKFGGDA